MPPTSIPRIPQELFEAVLSYMDFNSILQSSMVCREWNFFIENYRKFFVPGQFAMEGVHVRFLFTTYDFVQLCINGREDMLTTCRAIHAWEYLKWFTFKSIEWHWSATTGVDLLESLPPMSFATAKKVTVCIVNGTNAYTGKVTPTHILEFASKLRRHCRRVKQLQVFGLMLDENNPPSKLYEFCKAEDIRNIELGCLNNREYTMDDDSIAELIELSKGKRKIAALSCSCFSSAQLTNVFETASFAPKVFVKLDENKKAMIKEVETWISEHGIDVRKTLDNRYLKFYSNGIKFLIEIRERYDGYVNNLGNFFSFCLVSFENKV